MSKSRLKERNKAIRKAWERERELVSNGKGTRNWSRDQQKDILDLDIGKAYDETGRAFEGQHMKIAAEYPEYQGDLDNIQFLTRDEHLKAHKGSWQNPTNWYYNPETKEFVNFGENKPIPREVISLNDPVRSPIVQLQKSGDAAKDLSDSANNIFTEQSHFFQQEEVPCHSKKTLHMQANATPPPEVHESFGDKAMHAVEAVKKFGEKHPVIARIVKYGRVAALVAGSVYVKSKSSGSGECGSLWNDDDDYSSLSDSSVDYGSSNDDTGYDGSFNTRNILDERSMPREHIVTGHGQHYHTKDGVIWKEKDPYLVLCQDLIQIKMSDFTC